MIKLKIGLVALALSLIIAVPAHAGRVCGADGHFLKPLIPERLGNAKFTASCQVHDDCYSTCGKTRADCDREFHSSLRNSCKRAYGRFTREPCYRVVAGYYSAVHRNGRDPYDVAQKNSNCH